MKEHVSRRFIRLGLSLIEVVIGVIVLGVLISIALPRYTRGVERGKDKEAMADLYAIMAAEKIYKAKHGTYWPNRFEGWDSEHDVAIINTELGLDLKNTNFTFGVGTSGTSSAQAGAYRWDRDFNVGKFSRSWRCTTDQAVPTCAPEMCPVAECWCP